MMKIVQINCSISGSTGEIAKAIHQRLTDYTDESYIFYGIGNTTEKNMIRIGTNFDLHCHSVLSRNLGKQGYFSYFSTLKLIRELKKINPDVVHLHNLHGNYLQLPKLFQYLKECGVRVVITLHDCWLFTGKCPHFTTVKCYKWKEDCGNCPQLSIYPRSKKDTTSKCLVDKKTWLSGFENRMRIVAVSNWLRDIAKESYLSQYPIETIYNGINGDIFNIRDCSRVRRKYHLTNKFVVLGVSANWNEQKGLSEFLKIAENLNDDEIIVLVGLTEEQIKKMPPNIVGITRTNNQNELAELYSVADVFINTSKEETFGLVTAEAMACGTPVIVYNSTACAEIVDDKNGYVVESGNIDEILKYIKVEKQQKLKFRKLYSQKDMVNNYLNLYGRFYDK